MDRNFWKSADGERLTRMVFGRLLSGRSLGDLTLEQHEGRHDLRGIATPPTAVIDEMVESGEISKGEAGNLWIEDIALTGLDFTGANLPGLRFYNLEMRDCRFEKVRLNDLRVWRTRVRSSSFRGARLSNAVLGSWDEGRGNEYLDVDFSEADLRDIVCRSATFIDVDFSRAKLSSIDFGASDFVRCRFAGRLNEVIFWELPEHSPKPTPNPMEDIDFSDAELRYVEFRGLRLDRVKLPTGSEHVIVPHYGCVLERAAAELRGVSAIGGVLEHERHWAHPLRECGIWHREQLGDSEEERGAVEAVLRRVSGECERDGRC